MRAVPLFHSENEFFDQMEWDCFLFSSQFLRHLRGEDLEIKVPGETWRIRGRWDKEAFFQDSEGRWRTKEEPYSARFVLGFGNRSTRLSYVEFRQRFDIDPLPIVRERLEQALRLQEQRNGFLRWEQG